MMGQLVVVEPGGSAGEIPAHEGLAHEGASRESAAHDDAVPEPGSGPRRMPGAGPDDAGHGHHGG
jgi:hypothetical protein